MKEIRMGIVGTGLIASRLAAACQMTDGITPAAVSSRNAEKGAKFAAENGIEKVYCGTDALFAAPDIDLIYVATPHNTHFEICMQALEAGKNVLCEKPMVIKKSDAEALFAKAKEKHLFLMEGMWPRFLPNTQLVKKWIDDGRIGTVKFIDAIWSFAVDEASPKPRLVDPALAGGSMFDLGVYTVAMSSYYAGMNADEFAGFATDYRHGSDATAAMVMRYKNGILATLRTGITCDAPIGMTIIGTKGRIELPRFQFANKVFLYDANGEVTTGMDMDFAHPQGFCWQVEAVRDYLLNGVTESPVVPAADTIATAGVLEGMMHSFYPDIY